MGTFVAINPSRPSDRDLLLRVRALSKSYPVSSGGFLSKRVTLVRVLDSIDFDLHAGETLGLVGESGSGKTTTARCILRAIKPTAGSVIFHQRNGVSVDLAAISEAHLQSLRPQIQMIFQDPFSSLNPRMTAGRIVGEPLTIHKLARGSELDARVEEILKKVGLDSDDFHRYPHAFSGGQRQRIGIARALIMRPSLVVADEAVSALDVSVQAQILNLLSDLQEELSLTCLFIAHNLGVVRHLCDHVAVMYAGRIVEIAPTEQLFSDPLHPYTRTLLAAAPIPDPNRKLIFDVSEEIANPAGLTLGCSFHPQCPNCFSPCLSKRPRFRALDSSPRMVACHLYDPEQTGQVVRSAEIEKKPFF